MFKIESEKRLAIINHDNCKPKKCHQECKKICPVVKIGKACVEIEAVAKINEDLCIGCGLCVKACPFNAIQIVKLPTEINNDILHSYGDNSFRLYKLPIPKIGKIYGFIGQNGVGKSTLINILCGRIKPNFKKSTIENSEILEKVRGTELQKYFTKLYNNELCIKVKPQNIDKIQRSIQKKNSQATVRSLMEKSSKSSNFEDFKDSEDFKDFYNTIVKDLDLQEIFDNLVITLSGGEMQRLVCALVLLQKADVYIFDEFTNFLDIHQRLKMAILIRKLLSHNKYIFIVEHDMSILDYTSDIISIIYGKPAAYGIVSLPASTGDAINTYFSGYIASENVKFRPEAFRIKDNIVISYDNDCQESIMSLKYDSTVINYNNFTLHISDGVILPNVNLVLLMGKNGTGKTTYLNYLATSLNYNISYKPQYIDVSLWQDKNSCYPTVKDLLQKHNLLLNQLFLSDVIKPLNIPDIYDRYCNELSGGELQRLAITLCLGTPANIYLLDEPSASLDIEFRVIVTKVIKRFLLHNQKLGFIVEHDIMMVMSMGELNSKMVVFENSSISSPNILTRQYFTSDIMNFNQGINMFLQQLGITFRTDTKYSRPRINKLDSQKDQEQKSSNKYYI